MLFTRWLLSLKARVVAASAKRNNRKSRRTIPRQRSLLVETLEERLVPATLIVNTSADVVHPTDGTLSLRDAIAAVNVGNDNGLTAGEMNQVSGTFGVNDTIEFSSVLSGDTITLSGSALAISASVTITGLGASNLAVSGNHQSGVFTVASADTVSIAGLTIQDGNTGSGFVGVGQGGGIDNDGGTLTVSNSTLSDNSAGIGGGIYNFGTLMVNNSTLSDNSATGDIGGGGIFNLGSAFFQDVGTLTVSNSTLSDNSAGFGGGIENEFGKVTISNSTLLENSAGNGAGGGIYNDVESTLMVSNSTLSDNSGSGIANSSSTTLNNTIVANSTAGGDLAGSAFTGSYDIIGDGSDSSSFSHLLQGNPLLAPLGNYGGPTQTLALLPGSIAMGAGNDSLVMAAGLSSDQRGQLRSVNGAVDIGAFQTQTSLVVTTPADPGGISGQLSLREALNLANAGAAASESITFAPSLNGDTITLDGSTLAISASVTITGLGASNLAVSGNDQSQIFTVASGVQAVNITGLTIENGNATSGGGINNLGTLTVSNCTLSHNTASVSGGGIANGSASSTLTVSNSILSDNSATTGGGGGIGGVGGGIDNNGTLTVNSSTLSGNSVGFEGEGGGLDNAGTLTVSNSTLSGNSSDNDGGGICNLGTATVSNSTLADNSVTLAGGGAGIANFDASTLTVSNSTLLDNSAIGGFAVGGGISNAGTLTVSNSTLSGNSAGGGGGGIYINGGLVTLNNTIVANSTSGGDLFLNNSPNLFSHGSFTGSYDLIGDGSESSSFTHSLSGNPLLAPPGNYGGPTQTLALLPGSPALDAGSNALANSLTTDQRGEPRIVGAAVDLGAFESQGFTLAATSGSNQSTTVDTTFTLPLTVSVTANNSVEPVDGGVVTFTAPSAGASATLSASKATINGGSASVTVAANDTTGSYMVTASVSGVSQHASFALTNTTSSPPPPTSPPPTSPPPVSPPPTSSATAPAFTSLGTTTFATTVAGSFSVTFTGTPTAIVTESGALPSGITFNPATDVLAGKPLPGTNGSYPFILTASNSAGSTSQAFTLTINSPIDELGAYRASDGSWSLQSDPTSDTFTATDQVFYSFSPPGVIGVAGDWTGSGTSKIGYFDNGVWGLDLQGNGVLTASDTFTFGQAGDQPVVGDWTGNGVTDLGVFRTAPDGITGEFILDTNGDHIMDAGDETFTFGYGSDRLVVGDWNGAGKDEVGVFRDAAAFNAAEAGDAIFSLDTNGDHTYDAGDQVFIFGLVTDGMIVGDWNGAGKSEVGVYRDAGTEPMGSPLYAPGTALFSLDTNGDMAMDSGDQVFLYGLTTDQFVSGHWAMTPPLQPAMQLSANGEGPGAAALTQADLNTAVTQAIDEWASAGLNAASLSKLQNASVSLGTLDPGQLGETEMDQITIDATAAGWGWSTDGAPQTGKMDLDTVVAHELGHVLGLPDRTARPNDLMYEWLATGTSRTPSPQDVDALFTNFAML